jgi:predicted dienelactone hydrolase
VRWLPAALAAWVASAAPAVAGHGDAAPGDAIVRVEDRTVSDGARARSLPVRLRVPQPCTADRPRAVVLFSHGLGGSRTAGERWGEHWASHGLVVLHLQHPGSDESLWRGRSGGFTLANLRAGITAEQFVQRARDVGSALDALARLSREEPALACVDASRVGMSGHSFGAQTTQAVAGQAFPAAASLGLGGPAALREPRIAAAVAFSPSMRDDSPATRAAFAGIAVPFLSVTGSEDGDVVGTGVTPALRRAVFDALPAGEAFLLWFDGARHFAFNAGPAPLGAGRDVDVGPLERATRAITLAFWRATLEGDAQAAAWLRGHGPRALLGPKDEWRTR